MENMQTNLEKNTKLFFEVKCDEIGIRLDSFLQTRLHFSRNKIEKMLENEILLNGKKPKKCGIILKEKDNIEVLQSPTKPKENKDLEIQILYEDEEILILNKPCDLIVHQSSANDTQYTLVDFLQDKGYALSNLGDSYRAGILHRLDKGTSGAIIIAKSNQAHTLLSQQLKNREMGRYYLCVIDKPLKENITLEANILRHPKNRLKYITDPLGKVAKTQFFKIATNANLELICAKLFTGRTHQIRVHLAHLNRHILGDGFYGYKGNYQQRILLHAYFLYLTHPLSHKKIEIFAPLSPLMQDFIKTNFKEIEIQNLEQTFKKILI